MIIHTVAQGTSAWLELRKGIPTTSCFDKIMTPGEKPSTSADGYMNHLLAERILGRPIDAFKSAAMEHGNDFEANAIAAYEFMHNATTHKIGFITTDDGLLGCSPDSFIDEQPEGMLEAKSPTPAVQVSYLIAAGGASKEYKVQLQSELWICEKEWVDIVACAPGFPDAVFRTYRDDAFITKLAAHVRSFSGRLEERSEEFRVKGWIKAPPVVEEIEQSAAFLNDADISWAMSREYQ